MVTILQSCSAVSIRPTSAVGMTDMATSVLITIGIIHRYTLRSEASPSAVGTTDMVEMEFIPSQQINIHPYKCRRHDRYEKHHRN